MAGVNWRSAAASDAGAVRSDNQDRHYIDDERGVFLVVDGLGGHAAGEKAAETAVAIIRAELESCDGDVREGIRNAIAAANTVIWNSLRTTKRGAAWPAC